MPLIAKETIPPKKEQLNVRVDPDLLELLSRYCEFAESSTNYVIEQLLRYGFENDAEFQAWLAQHSTARTKLPKKSEAGS